MTERPFDPSSEDDATRPLSDLAAGERGVIVRVEGEPAVARRLMELGLVPGTPVTLVRRAPMGDPLECRLRDVHLSLRRAEARGIHVVAQ